MAKTVLRLQSISKYYYSDTSVTQALRRVSLEFEMGEFVAITGESGGGKSTLLNMISGLDTFDEGEMYFKGEPTFQYDDQDWEEYRRNQIGFVFQDYSLINHYTTLDNVLAALVIQGKKPSESKEEALYYLEQVGLKDLAEQRASELSSGQKQRLSIARALAKNTDILVADEPTGNLDSETGEQIIEILEKLSHKKLVIMVTHNYDQAAPYVTRRIRLHDGEVVTDVPVNERRENVNEDSPKGPEGEIKSDGTSPNYISGFFALRNIKMQKGRAFIFFSFFLITAVLSYLFLGEIFVFADDRITKKYDTEAYLQQNDTRLVVRYPDNRALTEEDQAAIRAVKHVEEVDLYDYANDVNYYIEKDRDYTTYFGDQVETSQGDPSGEEQETEYEKVQGIRLVDKSHFMKSSSALTENDLAAGRLPQTHNEIVLYSADDKKLDREQECYFSSDNLWEPGESCHQKLKIVGLLKEETEQVYFHPELCQMLTFSLDDFKFTADFYWDFKYKEYMGKFTPCFILVSDELEDAQIRISQNYELPSTGYGILPSTKESAFSGQGQLHLYQSVDGLSDEEIATARNAGLMGDEEYAQLQEDEEEGDQVFQIEYTEDFSDQGADFIEVSETLYQQLRDIYNIGTMQGSVYIDSYSKTDQVVKELQEMGYDAVSTFRVSATKYVQEEVYKRLEVIGISCLVLFLLVILQVLILRSILKIKEKDYHVLRFMGMQLKQMRGITYEEMGIHCVAAIVAAISIMGLLCLAQVSFIRNMTAYYTLWGGALYIVYNVLLMLLTVFFFNRLLRRSVS